VQGSIRSNRKLDVGEENSHEGKSVKSGGKIGGVIGRERGRREKRSGGNGES